jgi:signal transduction histidine kinase
MKVEKDLEGDSEDVLKKTEQYYQEIQLTNYKRTDRFFAFLMVAQWLAGILITLIISPFSWNGAESSIHRHVWEAVFFGGAISLFPVFLAIRRPGSIFTRQVITAGQMMTSALLIHLSGGRIETHFHIFGSLALLAFYRDPKVFPTATIITALDHFVRGYFFPASLFGVAYATPWRAVEHAAWVLFEVSFLLWSCRASNQDARKVARHRALEMQQRHVQKLESIGQLAAGIAHEINTPIQFVGDNIRFLQQEFTAINELLRISTQLSDHKEATIAQLDEAAKNLDAAYLVDEIPKALEQSLDGVQRITKIVSAMKEFSHPGHSEKQAIDINKTIESTVVVSTNEWKYVAEIDLILDSSIPLVPCIAGEFNQVILNLIVNAAHAIGDVKERAGGERGRITIRTKKLENKLEIRIQDTGAGIPQEIAHKVFDPFFTTKEVGKGTGQGLAIARSIIVNKHGGSIDFESKLGTGTTFILTLPLHDSAAEIAPPSCA